MDINEIEAFRQFLGIAPSKKSPSLFDKFGTKLAIGIGAFSLAIVCFRKFGQLLD